MSNLFAARLIGALFIISTVAYMTADEIISSVISASDYLEHVYPNQNLIAVSALLEFINCAAVVGIAIIIYPIIKPLSERAAAAYLSFRVIEAVLLIIGSVTLLSLVNVSQMLLEASAHNVEHVHAMAKALKAERYLNFQFGMIALSLCGAMLCVTFYQYRLIPRLLSALGIVGYTLLLLKVTSELFDINLGGELLYLPGSLFELVLLPLWLFTKGFQLPDKQRVAEVDWRSPI